MMGKDNNGRKRNGSNGRKRKSFCQLMINFFRYVGSTYSLGNKEYQFRNLIPPIYYVLDLKCDLFKYIVSLF